MRVEFGRVLGPKASISLGHLDQTSFVPGRHYVAFWRLSVDCSALTVIISMAGEVKYCTPSMSNVWRSGLMNVLMDKVESR